VASARLRGLVVRKVSELVPLLRGDQRILGLDVSPATVSVAVSDLQLRFAAPFGVMNRVSPEHEGAALRGALAPPHDPLNLVAVVVGVRVPQDLGWDAAEVKATVSYTDQLLAAVGYDDAFAFQGLRAVIFWNEADVMTHTVAAYNDFRRAAEFAGPKAFKMRQVRGVSDLWPLKVAAAKSAPAVVSRISASDILQAALDDLNRERRARNRAELTALRERYASQYAAETSHASDTALRAEASRSNIKASD